MKVFDTVISRLELLERQIADVDRRLIKLEAYVVAARKQGHAEAVYMETDDLGEQPPRPEEI